MIGRYIKNFLNKYPGDKQYWNQRYSKGGNSGSGSYNNLADFKSEIINNFIEKNGIETLIDLGCGDGNQIKQIKVKNYIGIDISLVAIENCKRIFDGDGSKKFYLFDDYEPIEKTNLAISMDVIFHLTEDFNYFTYLSKLFNSSQKYVIIYSRSDIKEVNKHVKDRLFLDDVEELFVEWKLKKVIKNKFPYDESNPDYTSRSDFFIFENLAINN